VGWFGYFFDLNTDKISIYCNQFYCCSKNICIFADYQEEARSKKQEARSKKQEVRSKKQEVRSKKQEVRSKKQEARSKKQEARSKKQDDVALIFLDSLPLTLKI
jgi:sortase (surface protein transpeptidase)